MGKRIWRLVLWLARVGMAWVPALALALWGAVYVRACFVAALSPGEPISYVYESASGVATVRAKSYVIDVVSQQVLLRGLTLTGSDGLVAARAESALVDMLPGSLHVRVKSLAASLDRGKNGQVDVNRLLPKPTGQPDKARVEIDIDRAEVTYRDLSRLTPLVQKFTIRGVNIARADGDTVVRADIQGSAKVAAWVKSGGDWSADVRLSGGDLSWLVAPVRLWAPDKIGDWSADKLAGQGKLLVDCQAGRVSVAGDADLRASGLTVGGTLQKAEATATVQGSLQRVRIKAESREPGRSASFDGVVAFGDKVSAAGKFSAAVKSRTDAWPVLAHALPKGVQFEGAVYSGSVSVRDNRPTVVGDLTADRVASGAFGVDRFKGTLGVNGDRVAVAAQNLAFGGMEWSGRVDLDTKSGAVKGFAETGDDFAKLLPPDTRADLRAPGRATVLLGGTVDHLTATLDGTAKVGWSPENRPSVELGDLVARARLRDGKVTVDRCLLRGQAVAAKLSGTLDVEKRTLDLVANVPGVRLDPFFDSVQGIVATDIMISGPWDAWSVTGRAEAYGIETGQVAAPQVVAEFHGGKSVLTFEEVRARLLGGRATGKGTVDLQHRAVAFDFNAQDLDVSRLTDGEVVGQLDLKDGHIGGTLDNLVADAKAFSVGVVAGGLRIDNATALVTLDGHTAGVSGLEATVGNGKVSAEGTFDMDTLASSLVVGWSRVDLSSLVPGTLDLATEGSTSGRFAWQDPGVGLPVAWAEVQLDDLALAHLELGSGSVTAEFDGRRVSATGSVGTINRYVQLVSCDYEIETERVSASADIAEFGLRQAVTAAVGRGENIPPRAHDLIRTLDGTVSAHLDVSGDPRRLTVAVPRLSAEGVTVGGRPMGDLVASGGSRDGALVLDRLLWTKGGGRIDANGSVDAQSRLSGKLEVVGLDVADLAAFLPGIDVSKGAASATLLFSGTTEKPQARGSAKLDEVVLQDGTGKPVPIPLTVNASEIKWRDGALVGDGDFTVATKQVQGGLTGTFVLKLPTDGWSIDDTKPVEADVRMDDRPLAALAGLWPEIEEKGTSGRVSAQVRVTGRAGDIQVAGDARVVADENGKSTMKLKSIAAPLRDVAARIDFGGRSATVAASATSPFGGKVALAGQLDAAEAFRQALSAESLLGGSSLDAKLTFDDLTWRGRMTGADKDSALTVKGEVTAKGTLDEPTLGGRLELHGTALNVAPGLQPAAQPGKPAVDPVFDNLTVVADHGTQVNIAAASVKLFGTGTLTGNLSDPTFSAEMGLDGGTLRLPTNRITLEDDGRIRVQAEGFPPTVRVDVELTGRTMVTARQTSDQYQTYAVNLDIRGNLLGEEPLRIVGTSDPPDLTNEQILAILGERQLIESLAQSALGRGTSQDLRDSFYSAAVPTLTAGFTENLAQGLGLDYVLLDYNPLDQAVVRAGKSLGKGFMLQGMRQLSEPTFGRIKYELALSFRPPFRDRFFSRVRFTLSTDQDVAWKAGLGWSIRF